MGQLGQLQLLDRKCPQLLMILGCTKVQFMILRPCMFVFSYCEKSNSICLFKSIVFVLFLEPLVQYNLVVNKKPHQINDGVLYLLKA
jgi:hypothetical protein